MENQDDNVALLTWEKQEWSHYFTDCLFIKAFSSFGVVVAVAQEDFGTA